MTDDVTSEDWAVRLRALPADQQAAMLAGAIALLQHPEALSSPLESEARIMAEQAYLALGTMFTA